MDSDCKNRSDCKEWLSNVKFCNVWAQSSAKKDSDCNLLTQLLNFLGSNNGDSDCSDWPKVYYWLSGPKASSRMARIAKLDIQKLIFEIRLENKKFKKDSDRSDRPISNPNRRKSMIDFQNPKNADFGLLRSQKLTFESQLLTFGGSETHKKNASNCSDCKIATQIAQIAPGAIRVDECQSLQSEWLGLPTAVWAAIACQIAVGKAKNIAQIARIARINLWSIPLQCLTFESQFLLQSEQSESTTFWIVYQYANMLLSHWCLLGSGRHNGSEKYLALWTCLQFRARFV